MSTYRANTGCQGRQTGSQAGETLGSDATRKRGGVVSNASGNRAASAEVRRLPFPRVILEKPRFAQLRRVRVTPAHWSFLPGAVEYVEHGFDVANSAVAFPILPDVYVFFLKTRSFRFGFGGSVHVCPARIDLTVTGSDRCF